MCRRGTRRIRGRDSVFFPRAKGFEFYRVEPVLAKSHHCHTFCHFFLHSESRFEPRDWCCFCHCPCFFCKNHHGLYFICVWDLFPLLRQGLPKDPSSLICYKDCVLQYLSSLGTLKQNNFCLSESSFLLHIGNPQCGTNTKQQQTARHTEKIRKRPLPKNKTNWGKDEAW